MKCPYTFYFATNATLRGAPPKWKEVEAGLCKERLPLEDERTF
jgi:hypothetical protein